MLCLGDILTARAAAKYAIAWLDNQRSGEDVSAQRERMELLIRKLDEILEAAAPGIFDDVEHDEETIVLVGTQRSIH
jgi:hypothetical protein